LEYFNYLFIILITDISKLVDILTFLLWYYIFIIWTKVLFVLDYLIHDLKVVAINFILYPVYQPKVGIWHLEPAPYNSTPLSCDRKFYLKTSFAGSGFNFYFALMFLNNYVVTDVKSEPCPFAYRFCSKERIENFCLNILRDPWS